MNAPFTIRLAEEKEFSKIWPIFKDVIATGDTFAHAPDTTEEEARQYWFSPGTRVHVAEQNGEIVGAYHLRPNRPGLGNHVGNAGFIVAKSARGAGIGRALGEHAIKTARESGFLALQYNFVVSTNEKAVALWKSLGYNVIGTIPQAYRHGTLGLVDVYIMHRFL